MKSFTDIEQSEKLVEILPIESADMTWKMVYGKRFDFPYYEEIILTPYKLFSGLGVPCWSLSALLNYLREIDFFPDTDADEHSVTMSINYYDEDEGKLLNPVHNIKVEAESFVDACYEMILKLHELKML